MKTNYKKKIYEGKQNLKNMERINNGMNQVVTGR
jgi:hypothetical protein